MKRKWVVLILIGPKPADLDPEVVQIAKTIKGAPFNELVDNLRTGRKWFRFVLSEPMTRREARQKTERLATDLLTNPVIESYEFSLTPAREEKKPAEAQPAVST